MGGCASRPRGSEPEVMPAENPAVHDQTGDPPKQVDAGESNNAEPLVDLSEAKADAPTSGTADPFTALSTQEFPLGATKEAADPAQVTQSIHIEAHSAEVKNETEEAKLKEDKLKEDKLAAEPESVEVTGNDAATKKTNAAAVVQKSDDSENTHIAAAAITA